ncbi:hypothetical protein [uncultured Shewanella sp.]|uniref:hypothetical protein n=1 Tax=uncultured Shewanella sp. TaxID=173975 RepID=UPI00260C03CC|nr:hypothetical protein [uncultured Shewanella sp.]
MNYLDNLNIFLAQELTLAREKAELSQQQVADISYIDGSSIILSQRKVSRIEKEPLSSNSIDIAAYMVAIGKRPQDFFDLLHMGMDKFRPSIKMDILEMKTITSEKIKIAITNAYRKLDIGQGILVNTENPSPTNNALIESFNLAKNNLESLNRKPTIGMLGHYDSGKTSMINVIVGTEGGIVLPEDYQPTTNILNLLMHESDRPETLTKEPVAVFRKGFKPHMIHDQKLVNNYLIGQGGQTFLAEIGQHSYGEVNPEYKNAYIAVIFMDSPILEKLWLLDTPGDMNGDESEDSEIAISGVELVDGLFFLDGASGFLDKNSFGFFSEILRANPPVDPCEPMAHIRLFATKAHTVSTEQMSSLRNKLAKRYSNQFNDLIFKSWVDDLNRAGNNITLNAFNSYQISDVIFPYAREIPELKENMLHQLDEMAGYLLAHHCKFIEQSADKVLESQRILLRNQINQTKKFKDDIGTRKSEASERAIRFRLIHSNVKTALNRILEESVPELRSNCEKDMMNLEQKLSNESFVEALIRDNYSDKKEAANSIGDHIGQLISSEFETTIKRNSSAYSDKVQLAMNQFESELSQSVGDAGYKIGDTSIDFDAKAAFIGGLTGLTSFGAMSMYASAVAAGSNLGGYILSAKVAGILVNLGIASSTTAVISTISTLGGPVGIGIAIASLIGLLAWKFFGASWEESLANKIVKSINKKPFMDTVQPKIDNFWNETASALKACMVNLEIEMEKDISASNAMAESEFVEKDVDIWLYELTNVLSALDGHKVIDSQAS